MTGGLFLPGSALGRGPPQWSAGRGGPAVPVQSPAGGELYLGRGRAALGGTGPCSGTHDRSVTSVTAIQKQEHCEARYSKKMGFSAAKYFYFCTVGALLKFRIR